MRESSGAGSNQDGVTWNGSRNGNRDEDTLVNHYRGMGVRWVGEGMVTKIWGYGDYYMG